MNTHDKYELPPLPDLPAYSSEVFDREVKVVSETMAEQLMHDYARAAIEPYQQRIAELESQLEAIGAGGVSSQRITSQRRGEPVAKVNDDGFIVETGLGLAPGTKLYATPQPGEPVKEPSNDERAAQGLPPYSPRHLTEEEWNRLTENGRKAWGKKPDEPVRVPSDEELLHAIIKYADARATITENRMAGIAEVDRERDRLAHDECAQAYADMTALLARYGQNPTIPAGWKLVPAEPTIGMMFMGVSEWAVHDDPEEDVHGVREAMLAAAPEPPCTL